MPSSESGATARQLCCMALCWEERQDSIRCPRGKAQRHLLAQDGGCIEPGTTIEVSLQALPVLAQGISGSESPRPARSSMSSCAAAFLLLTRQSLDTLLHALMDAQQTGPLSLKPGDKVGQEASHAPASDRSRMVSLVIVISLRQPDSLGVGTSPQGRQNTQQGERTHLLFDAFKPRKLHAQTCFQLGRQQASPGR